MSRDHGSNRGAACWSYHSVQHRTRRPRVTLSRSNVLRPSSIVARYASSNDASRLVFGEKDVQSCKPEVPCRYKEVGEYFEELLRDSHCNGGVDDSVVHNGQMLNKSQGSGREQRNMFSHLATCIAQGIMPANCVAIQETSSAMPTFRHPADDQEDKIQLDE